MEENKDLSLAEFIARSVTPGTPVPGASCPSLPNTYIGMRYVPKFADPIQWNINTQYEPMTIVINDGNSYTSRTWVAPGTNITNETYWAPTGNYNSQVEAYRQEVLAVQSDVNILKSDNTNNKNNIKYLNSLLPKNRQIIIVGDSYIDTAGSTGNIPWTTTLINSMPEANFIISAHAGYSLTSGGFLNLFNSALEKVTDPTRYTQVYVCGFYNDWNKTISEINTAINNFIQGVESSTLSNFEIIFIPYGASLNWDVKSSLFNTFCNLNNINNFLSARYHTSYILDSAYVLCQANLFAADGFHPSQIGQNRLAYYMSSVINGTGFSNAVPLTVIGATALNNYTVPNNILAASQLNGYKTIYIQSGSISGDITLSPDSDLDIATYDCQIIHDDHSDKLTIPCIARARINNVVKSLPAQIKLKNQKITIRLCVDEQMTATNVIFQGGSITVPALWC